MNTKIIKTFNNQGFAGCATFFIGAICILSFASASSKGAFEGLKICSSIIIPSLFPFTVLSILLQKSGGLLWIGNLINKVSFPLFRINGTDFSVIIISLIGGYPIGSKIINELYKSNQIDKKTAKRLLRFCVNPSPAFIVSALGVNVLKSKTAGLIFLFSNTTACIILNLIFNRSRIDNIKKPKEQLNCGENFSDSFVFSVLEGAKIILNICAFVTLFSSIAEIIKPAFEDRNFYALFCPFLEISFGIIDITKSGLPMYFYSFLLAFGGASTICQIKQSADNLKPSFFEIVFYRIIHGSLATVISYLLFKLFPQTSAVFSNGTAITFGGYALFFPSIMLIIFSVLFLMFFSYENKTTNNN